MSPPLQNTKMWVVGYLVKDHFCPVSYTAAYTRKDSIRAFMSNSVVHKDWAFYEWPKGMYAVCKIVAMAR